MSYRQFEKVTIWTIATLVVAGVINDCFYTFLPSLFGIPLTSVGEKETSVFERFGFVVSMTLCGLAVIEIISWSVWKFSNKEGLTYKQWKDGVTR